jgi:hypothetical protein
MVGLTFLIPDIYSGVKKINFFCITLVYLRTSHYFCSVVNQQALLNNAEVVKW